MLVENLSLADGHKLTLRQILKYGELKWWFALSQEDKLAEVAAREMESAPKLTRKDLIGIMRDQVSDRKRSKKSGVKRSI